MEIFKAFSDTYMWLNGKYWFIWLNIDIDHMFISNASFFKYCATIYNFYVIRYKFLLSITIEYCIGVWWSCFLLIDINTFS